MEHNAMRMGQRIKMQREKKGWSQHELARQSGIPQATISRLESGDMKDIQTMLARRLARALGVGLDYLAGTFEDDEDAELAKVVLAG
jgi:transcriptional regulator with XRE-family HTH domain